MLKRRTKKILKKHSYFCLIPQIYFIILMHESHAINKIHTGKHKATKMVVDIQYI